MQFGGLTGHFQFHPVGQGLFYSGVIDNGKDSFVFVYDCGGTNKKIVGSEADKFIDSLKGREIDLIVLSHLHEDHINGLDIILKNLKSGGRIVMPFIDRKLQILYQYQHSMGDSTDSFLDEFYSDPIGAIQERCNHEALITMISSFADDIVDDEYCHEKTSEEGSENSFNLYKIDGKNGIPVTLSQSFDIHSIGNFKWRIRITQPFFDIEIYKKYRSYLNGVKDLADLLINRQVLNRLRRINRFQNRSCLLMEHGPELPMRYRYSVLTGDLPETMIRRVKDMLLFPDDIFVYQIPHHGAKAKVSVTDSDKNVVSFGINNRFGHPDNSTLIQYLKRSIYEVNEKSLPYTYDITA